MIPVLYATRHDFGIASEIELQEQQPARVLPAQRTYEVVCISVDIDGHAVDADSQRKIVAYAVIESGIDVYHRSRPGSLRRCQ